MAGRMRDMFESHGRLALSALLSAVISAGPAAAITPFEASHPIASGPLVRIASLYDSRPDLKALRAKLVAKGPITRHELRLLADAGDGLAAFRLAEQLTAENDPALLSDAAFYFTVAAYRGRDYALPPLKRILADPSAGIAADRLGVIEKALVTRANAGDGAAAAVLADLYATGAPFGLKPAEARAMLELAARETRDGALALRMATMLASETALQPDDIRVLRHYLQIALGSDDLSVRTAAENLLRTYPEPGEGDDG